MTTRSADLPVAIGALLLGSATVLAALQIDNRTGTPVGPGTFPLVVGAGIGVGGLSLLLQVVWSDGHSEPTDAGLRRGDGGTGTSRWNLASIPLVTLAFCGLALSLGIEIATSFAFIACGRIIGGYRWTICILAGLVAGLIVQVVFSRMLDVTLPSGLMG